MNNGKITVITPPDHLFNSTLAYLLVKPSIATKQHFYEIISSSCDDINVFVFDEHDHDIAWLLSTANQSDIIIVDIDNCDRVTKQFVTLLLAKEDVYYITTDEITPYHLISKNRIYDLEMIVSRLNSRLEDDYPDEEDDD